MKLPHKIITLLAIIAFSYGCKNNADNEETEITTEQVNTDVTDTTDLEPQSPQNILAPTAEEIKKSTKFADWTGKYTGNLPCGEGCEGIRTAIYLAADSTYTLSQTIAPVKNKPTRTKRYKGNIVWNKQRDTIVLDTNGTALRFKVMEGMLKRVEKNEGESSITDKPDKRYFLQKEKLQE
ncbi:hypothetical protein GCM10007424_24670 [Flavobacterium suaedae]|uniref:Copper resistance protein NlpE n=1 Tax=Flavobacterium suaedae TaxID=1767027 RepID=A0ABQ1JZV6_9FLAO|nr:copper resistance protein NlpE N-terminal domain-containing protein [Flavobacterium suaedae]GGB83712.1 hypothetical protein GCM10007424_24670 [Flavobacterium suaedae]